MGVLSNHKILELILNNTMDNFGMVCFMHLLMEHIDSIQLHKFAHKFGLTLTLTY